jgi:hypothetical protein
MCVSYHLRRLFDSQGAQEVEFAPGDLVSFNTQTALVDLNEQYPADTWKFGTLLECSERGRWAFGEFELGDQFTLRLAKVIDEEGIVINVIVMPLRGDRSSSLMKVLAV